MKTLSAYKKFEKVDTSDEDKVWAAYLASHSRELHEGLVSRYLPLVMNEVDRLSIRVRQKMERNELISSGVLGLHNAITGFDPGKGFQFSTFANMKIRGAILDELRKQDHLTRNQRKQYKTICESIRELSIKLGRSPSMEEISEATGIAELDITETMGMASNALSIDSENKQGIKYTDIISDDKNNQPWEEADNILAKESMREAFKHLPERDQQLLYLKHYKDLRVKEIAQVMDISEGRVSQMYKEILIKLRSIMQLE